jgi:hypothetical protein
VIGALLGTTVFAQKVDVGAEPGRDSGGSQGAIQPDRRPRGDGTAGAQSQRGRGGKKGKRKGKRNDDCTRAGNAPKRGKPCCKGLVRDGTGQCAAAPSSSPPSPTCEETCTGCCLATGECQLGTSDDACGGLGGRCADCTEFGRECVNGTCECTQTSCATGCCDSQRVCQVENDKLCGLGGHDCATDCTETSRECVRGSCTCTETSCSGGCCEEGEKTCRRDHAIDACGSDGRICDVCARPPENPPADQTCPPTNVEVQCCKNDFTGSRFCSCNGFCCEGQCFLETSGCGEFCCNLRGGVICPNPDAPDDRSQDACCEDGKCPCFNQSGRFGSNRRPGR